VFTDSPQRFASNTRLRQAQEAIEAAMQRQLTRAADTPTDEAFSYAVALTDKQPVFSFRTSTSVENQQYSTPLPMSVAAQRVLAPVNGDTLLEPS
jgi:excinuclease UvrABC nuclease subunit